MDTVNYGHLSRQLKEFADQITTHAGRPDEIRTLADANADGYGKDGFREYPIMFGGLAADCMKLKWEVALPLEHVFSAVNRLERIERALDSIGVNLDEEDIAALEIMANDDDYRRERTELRTAFNLSVGDIQDSEREAEQEQALEALAKAGFVLNDDDDETWTKDNVTVKIELIDGSKCQYRWEYESPRNMDSGLSGEFHRLLALIGQSVSSDSSEGSGTSKKEVLQ